MNWSSGKANAQLSKNSPVASENHTSEHRQLDSVGAGAHYAQLAYVPVGQLNFHCKDSASWNYLVFLWNTWHFLTYLLSKILYSRMPKSTSVQFPESYKLPKKNQSNLCSMALLRLFSQCFKTLKLEVLSSALKAKMPLHQILDQTIVRLQNLLSDQSVQLIVKSAVRKNFAKSV